MSPEELDEARAKEAVREMEERNTRFSFLEAATIAARKAREGWTPPEPDPDPDLVAYQEWVGRTYPPFAPGHDGSFLREAFLAGAAHVRAAQRWGRGQ